MSLVVAAAASTVALTGGVAHAVQQTQPASVPTTQPAPQVEKLQATVTGLEGIVQARTAEDQPWQKVTVGMVLDENAEFRTGPRSAVRFTIPPDQTITLDRLGTVKVLQAVNDNGKIKTNLGMRYGRTRYDVEAAGREHESTISSPSSTLAVRGTQVSLYDQRPFTPQAVSLTGRAEFRDARKRIRFGGKGAGKLKVDTKEAGAAQLALSESVVDPATALARSDSETSLIQTLLSRGATIGYDYDKGIKVVRGGVPPTDGQLIPVLPGTLNFVLRWTGNADLNLVVQSPQTDPTIRTSVIPIGGRNTVLNGGRTDFDHRGGPNGGIEIVYWPGKFPLGAYQIGSVLISGEHTPAAVDVFQGGKRVDIRTGQGPQQTVNFIAEDAKPGISNGQLIGSVRLLEEPGLSPASVAPAKKAKKKPAAQPAPAVKTVTKVR
ncbi:MAG: FecR domain-containing protein [Tepidisphaeraceae bacterium]